MRSERIRLAAVLTASAAFLVSCDNQNCKNALGQPVNCRTPGATHVGGYFWGGNGGKNGGQADGVARGGFGSEGGAHASGGHGGGE